MKKCPHCNSCFKTVWFEYKVYQYCSLCFWVFDPFGLRILDNRIIEGIKRIEGFTV